MKVMTTTYADRLKIILDVIKTKHGLKSNNQIAGTLGITNSAITQAFKRKEGGHNSAIVQSLSNVYDVNREWLLTGSGEQFIDIQQDEKKIRNHDFWFNFLSNDVNALKTIIESISEVVFVQNHGKLVRIWESNTGYALSLILWILRIYEKDIEKILIFPITDNNTHAVLGLLIQTRKNTFLIDQIHINMHNKVRSHEMRDFFLYLYDAGLLFYVRTINQRIEQIRELALEKAVEKIFNHEIVNLTSVKEFLTNFDPSGFNLSNYFSPLSETDCW